MIAVKFRIFINFVKSLKILSVNDVSTVFLDGKCFVLITTHRFAEMFLHEILRYELLTRLDYD